MPFYPGPGLGGHCIEGSEIVWVKDGSKSQIISLHDLFEKESIKYGIRKIVKIVTDDLRYLRSRYKKKDEKINSFFNEILCKLTINLLNYKKTLYNI
jgi:UDP-N-acetyl-D-mannosaminuronate dehydrogenase